MKKRHPHLSKSTTLIGFLILFCIFGFTDTKSPDLNSSLRIVLYDSEDFASFDVEVRKNIRNLKYIHKNNKTSSIVVDEGTVAKVYSAPHYEGCSFTIVGPYEIPKLDSFFCGCSDTWDDAISSIELYPNSDERSAGIYGISSRKLPRRYPHSRW